MRNCFGRELDSHGEAVGIVKHWTRDSIEWQENDASTVIHFAAETGRHCKLDPCLVKKYRNNSLEHFFIKRSLRATLGE